MGRGMRNGAPLEEIEALYRRDLERFLRVAAAVVGDRELAHDAVHEGFAAAIRKRQSFAARGSLDGWVWRVVINSIRNYRRETSAPLSRHLDPSLHLAAANGDAAESRALRAAVAALPERQRLVLFLRYYADLDYTTIADALGVRRGTVGATLNAARARLRQALGELVND